MLPECFVGITTGWWGVVSQADATYFSESWPWLWEYILHYLLTACLLDKVRECYHKCQFCSGVENSQESPYPLDKFKSQRKPPRPCCHCGCEYHWDNNCPPHKADLKKAGGKPWAGMSGKGSSAYQKAYKALQVGTDEEFSLAFTACINYSDDSSKASEEPMEPPEDNETRIVPAYLLKGEDKVIQNPLKRLPYATGQMIFDPPMHKEDLQVASP